MIYITDEFKEIVKELRVEERAIIYLVPNLIKGKLLSYKSYKLIMS